MGVYSFLDGMNMSKDKFDKLRSTGCNKGSFAGEIASSPLPCVGLARAGDGDREVSLARNLALPPLVDFLAGDGEFESAMDLLLDTLVGEGELDRVLCPMLDRLAGETELDRGVRGGFVFTLNGGVFPNKFLDASFDPGVMSEGSR